MEMGDLRSSHQSYRDGRKLEIINGKACNVRPRAADPPQFAPRTFAVRKTVSSSSSSVKSWWNDPEMKRKKRIAKYKYYAVEGKVKSSLKKGYRWFKRKCSKIVRGF